MTSHLVDLLAEQRTSDDILRAQKNIAADPIPFVRAAAHTWQNWPLARCEAARAWLDKAGLPFGAKRAFWANPTHCHAAESVRSIRPADLLEEGIVCRAEKNPAGVEAMWHAITHLLWARHEAGQTVRVFDCLAALRHLEDAANTLIDWRDAVGAARDQVADDLQALSGQAQFVYFHGLEVFVRLLPPGYVAQRVRAALTALRDRRVQWIGSAVTPARLSRRLTEELQKRPHTMGIPAPAPLTINFDL